MQTVSKPSDFVNAWPVEYRLLYDPPSNRGFSTAIDTPMCLSTAAGVINPGVTKLYIDRLQGEQYADGVVDLVELPAIPLDLSNPAVGLQNCWGLDARTPEHIDEISFFSVPSILFQSFTR